MVDLGVDGVLFTEIETPTASIKPVLSRRRVVRNVLDRSSRTARHSRLDDADCVG